MPAKDLQLTTSFRRTVSHLLNIAPEEWEKVGFSWTMKLFLATGHVIGHTTLLALVASRYGVEKLPLFFVASALLALVATLITTPLLERVRKERLILFAAVAGSAALAVATLLSHSALSSAMGIALVVVGMGMSQLGIILALFIEEQYSPFESQRTFPIIESAEVVGSLLGGLTIYLLVSRIEATGLLAVWAASLACLAAVTGLFLARSQVVPQLQLARELEHRSVVEVVREGFVSLQRVNFLRTLAASVFTLAAISKLIEYQYAAALAGAASGEGHGAAGVEEVFAHALGLYVIAFSLIALLVQLLLSSRIIRRIGTIPSLLMSPLLSTFAFTGLLLQFTPLTAVGARLTYDLTQIIYKDAYLSSYYAVSHHIRERAKALIEGWILPLGTLAGTLFLILIETLAHGGQMHTVVTLVLLACGLVALLLLRRLRAHYTQLSVVTLATGDESERRTAVEILGDRGHEDSTRHLVRRLSLPNETPDMKVKVLETLGRLQDDVTIPSILDTFSDRNLTVKTAAVEALGNFPNLGSQFFREAFTKYRVIHALKELFLAGNSARLKLAIMRVFANLREGEIIPFLLEVLQSSDVEVQADCINVIGSFRDPNIVHYLRPYLQNSDPRLKSNALIALWQFEGERLNLLVQLVQLLSKTDRDSIISTLYVLGEIRSTQELATVEGHLSHEDAKVRRHAAMALLKFGDLRAIDHLLPIVLGSDPVESWKARQMLQRVELQARRVVTRRIHQEVARRVNLLLTPVQHDPRRLTRVELMELIRLYDLAEQHAEVIKLKALLSEQQRTGTNGEAKDATPIAAAAAA